MEQRRPRRSRALPTHLRGFLVEGVSSSPDPCELSQLAAVIRLDHTYSCISGKAQRPTGLEERYLKNAAVLPDIRPAASVSSVDVCQQEEPVSIHGCNVQGYQNIYSSVAEPMMKTRCGRRRPYSLELGLKIKQRLWETLKCPSLVETEQPDGSVLITESFSTTSRSFAPRIHVDISEEPLPIVDRSQLRCQTKTNHLILDKSRLTQCFLMSFQTRKTFVHLMSRVENEAIYSLHDSGNPQNTENDWI